MRCKWFTWMTLAMFCCLEKRIAVITLFSGKIAKKNVLTCNQSFKTQVLLDSKQGT